MINKTQLLKHFANEYDLINKISGWCEQAKDNREVYTDFLDMRQLAILESILQKEKINNYQVHHGLVNSFRATVTINTAKTNLTVLTATQPSNQVLKHNEIMGYLLNEMQLSLRVIGDLYLQDNKIYLTVLTKVAPLFLNSPLYLQNRLLTFTISDHVVTINYQYEVMTKNIKSLRIDAVISAICNVSRNKAQMMVDDKLVFRNFSQVENRTFQIECDNIISIRKYGRYQIQAVTKLKNDNYRIIIAKFK